MRSALSPMRRRTIERKPWRRVALCTHHSSGLTRPCTTISPRPQAPVTSTTSREPLSVSSVKITPAQARSLRTIFWTPTESATSVVRDAVLGAIHDRAVGEERGHAGANGAVERRPAAHVQVGLVQPREGGARQILGGGAAAHRHIGIALTGRRRQTRVGRERGSRDLRRQRRIGDAPAQRGAGRRHGRRVRRVQARQRRVHGLVQARHAQVMTEGLGGQREAVRNAHTRRRERPQQLARTRRSCRRRAAARRARPRAAA